MRICASRVPAGGWGILLDPSLRFNTYLIIIWLSNFCQADLRGRPPQTPLRCAELFSESDYPSASNVLHTKPLFYFIYTCSHKGIVNSNRAQHAGYTATTFFEALYRYRGSKLPQLICNAYISFRIFSLQNNS